MQLYANPNRQQDLENCAEFERFMKLFEWATFTQPSLKKAPWHVQCVIKSETGDNLIINFWPHKLKGQYMGASVEGIDNLRGLMALAIDDSHDKNNQFNVIETVA